MVLFHDRDGRTVETGPGASGIDPANPPPVIFQGTKLYQYEGADAQGRLVYRQWPPRPVKKPGKK